MNFRESTSPRPFFFSIRREGHKHNAETTSIEGQRAGGFRVA